MSSGEALRRLRGLGYKDLEKVPVGAGNDYLNTLVLIAKDYNFGGITFDEAMRNIHDSNWEKRDAETKKRRELLGTANLFYK